MDYKKKYLKYKSKYLKLKGGGQKRKHDSEQDQHQLFQQEHQLFQQEQQLFNSIINTVESAAAQITIWVGDEIGNHFVQTMKEKIFDVIQDATTPMQDVKPDSYILLSEAYLDFLKSQGAPTPITLEPQGAPTPITLEAPTPNIFDLLREYSPGTFKTMARLHHGDYVNSTLWAGWIQNRIHVKMVQVLYSSQQLLWRSLINMLYDIALWEAGNVEAATPQKGESVTFCKKIATEIVNVIRQEASAGGDGKWDTANAAQTIHSLGSIGSVRSFLSGEYLNLLNQKVDVRLPEWFLFLSNNSPGVVAPKLVLDASLNLPMVNQRGTQHPMVSLLVDQQGNKHPMVGVWGVSMQNLIQAIIKVVVDGGFGGERYTWKVFRAHMLNKWLTG
jgi:hypothetical protein